MIRPSILRCFHTLRAVALLVSAAWLLPAASSRNAIAADPPGSTASSSQNEETLQRELDLAQTSSMMLQELRYIEAKYREAQSALESTSDAPSKAMHQAELDAMAMHRSRLRVKLAVNRLSEDALLAPPDVRTRIDELAKQTTGPTAKSAAEFAAWLRDAETIRTVCQLLVAAENLRRIGKSDSAARVSREADLLEGEFKTMLEKRKEQAPKRSAEDPFAAGPKPKDPFAAGRKPNDPFATGPKPKDPFATGAKPKTNASGKDPFGPRSDGPR